MYVHCRANKALAVRAVLRRCADAKPRARRRVAHSCVLARLRLLWRHHYSQSLARCTRGAQSLRDKNDRRMACYRHARHATEHARAVRLTLVHQRSALALRAASLQRHDALERLREVVAQHGLGVPLHDVGEEGAAAVQVLELTSRDLSPRVRDGGLTFLLACRLQGSRARG